LQVGANKTVYNFTGKANAAPPYSTFAAYEEHMNYAIRRYNYAWFDKSSGTKIFYGDAVIQKSRLYAPNVVTPVFQ
jgi:hypothetical protein